VATGVINADNFFEYSFLSHPGNPLIDGRLFFHTPDNQKVMIVKQLKHSEKPNEKVTSINFIHIEKWYKQLKTRLSKIALDYIIIYLFITNKTITQIPLKMPDNLLIVHSKNLVHYFGPVVSQFAELTKFNNQEETIEYESDNEEYFEQNLCDEEM